MNPLLKIPIIVVNNEQKEAEKTARILPSEIGYYYPGFYDGTIIVMKSGHSHLTMLSTEQIDGMLQAYEKSVKANPGKFGILEITTKNPLHAAN